MKYLLIFLHNYIESLGGIESFGFKLIEWCKVNPENQYYFLMLTESTNKIEKYDDHLTVEFFAFDKNPQKLKQKLLDVKSFFDFETIIAENFINTNLSHSVTLLNLKNLFDIKIFIHLHSYPVDNVQICTVKDIDWDGIICVSTSLALECVKLGAPASKIKIVHFGVKFEEDLEKKVNKLNVLHDIFSIDKNKKIILHASRIVTGNREILTSKGITDLLTAFNQIHKKTKDWVLVIAVARAPERVSTAFSMTLKLLNDMITAFGLSEKVFVKTFEASEMPEVYKSSDLFVLASETETFGMVVVEAMSEGLPVITTGVGGLADIVEDGYNSIVINPHDIVQLKKAILLMINDEQLRQKISQNALLTVKNNFNCSERFAEFFKVCC